ncbi:hypothetical protein BV898_09793 [Hypsibius exemplaris]|uniref:WAP domain-containing protein n=1 Tax=Hypsibius exemplaris TaxID=2072580 RepID=A0A1W0WLC1_HYPEX|nr:hypothetical protein BV898_09793 [Hypsibius exemplaris]
MPGQSLSRLIVAVVLVSFISTATAQLGGQCRNGQPLVNPRTGQQWYCGMGSSTPCPNGYTCNVHPADAWAVCCASANQPINQPIDQPGSSKCPSGGSALIDSSTGQEWFCGMGSSSKACPNNYACSVHPADWWAVCCPLRNSQPSAPATTTGRKCRMGNPLVDRSTGRQWFCGRGGKVCPRSYTCNVDALDRFAVCCLNQ